MKPELLKEVIEKIRGIRIAIIGDFCLDGYWFIDEAAGEISIETGKLTQPVRNQKYSLGGAGNVANNLAAMGAGKVTVLGVIGNDPFGNEMVSIMKMAGIDTTNLLVQEKEWSTHVYVKPYSAETEQERIDFGNFNILSDETTAELIKRLEEEAGKADLVIINEQVRSGIHTPLLRKKLVEITGRFRNKIFIADSRNYTDWFDGSYRKMNDHEALRLCGVIRQPDEPVSIGELSESADTLFKRYHQPLMITRGSRGSIVAGKNGITEVPGLQILSRVDTVGAGDSYLAGAAAVLAAGYSIETAAEFGTLVAGVTVQKLFQTGTATPAEIMVIGTDPDFTYNPDLSEDIRKAEYFGGTGIEIITKPVGDRKIRYAVFDNDGTLSTLREGWELIMGPMMVRAILGERFTDAEEPVIGKVRNRVSEFIDKTTGIQTLMQMKMLTQLVKEFGFVPEDQVLDEHGYKMIYNDELMKMVSTRVDKIKKGELSSDDFTIKGSVRFLEHLAGLGIRLFLTSGTDIEDVMHEAAILGYNHYFDGGIHGAVGDITREAKKVVLDRLLDSIGTGEAGSIVTFGDGPVEIRETHKRGGVTVGVASNELRRHGLNQIKRTRLIKAGADLIIPDFSEPRPVLELLNFRNYGSSKV